jgi:hypothetical protein
MKKSYGLPYRLEIWSDEIEVQPSHWACVLLIRRVVVHAGVRIF